MHTHMDDDTLIRCAEQALTRSPDFGYYGNIPLFESWGMTPVMQHRDSDALERSNYRRILQDMQKMFPDEDMGDNILSWVDDFRSSHWAVGWAEQLVVRVLYDADDDITPDNITCAFRWIMETASYLSEEYPIYDESDYSELEYEETQEAYDSAWDDLCRHWDEEDDGPEPTDDEKQLTWEAMTESEFPSCFDEDKMREILDDKRLADAIAQYGDVPRVGTVIPGQLAMLPHPLEGE